MNLDEQLDFVIQKMTCKYCGETKFKSEFRHGSRKCRDCLRSDNRAWHRNNPERSRENSRRGSARRRAADPLGEKARDKAWKQANRNTINRFNREYNKRRFFWAKVRKLAGDPATKTKEVAALWKRQRGLCALTGEKLDRSAHLDHKMPRARGGGDDIANLQWLSNRANFAKRDLTNSEFAWLCEDVVRWQSNRQAIQKIIQLGRAA